MAMRCGSRRLGPKGFGPSAAQMGGMLDPWGHYGARHAAMQYILGLRRAQEGARLKEVLPARLASLGRGRSRLVGAWSRSPSASAPTTRRGCWGPRPGRRSAAPRLGFGEGPVGTRAQGVDARQVHGLGVLHVGDVGDEGVDACDGAAALLDRATPADVDDPDLFWCCGRLDGLWTLRGPTVLAGGALGASARGDGRDEGMGSVKRLAGSDPKWRGARLTAGERGCDRPSACALKFISAPPPRLLLGHRPARRGGQAFAAWPEFLARAALGG